MELVYPKSSKNTRIYGCFLKMVVPQNGWFTMENPIKLDDLAKVPNLRKHSHIRFTTKLAGFRTV